MGSGEWLQGLCTGSDPPIAYLPLKKFAVTDDEAILRAEILGAIDELNVSAKEFSGSKTFSRDYLDLITKAEGHAREKRWTDAHRTVWEATFLVNRARETVGAGRSRRLVSIFALVWLVLLAVLGLILKQGELDPRSSAGLGALFGFTYWRYVLLGSLGGVTIVLWGLIKHTTGLDFDTHYLSWYFLKPVLGGIVGLVAVLIVLAGLFSVQGPAPLSQPLPLYIVAFLAGFSERFSIRIIDRVMTALFGGEPTPPPGGSAVPKTPVLPGG